MDSTTQQPHRTHDSSAEEQAREIAAGLEGVRERIAAAAREAGRDPEGIRLLPVSKTVPAERLRAAVAARDASGRDMLVIGRTDALGTEGIEAALERARRYAGAGVDLTFVDGIRTIAQVEAVARDLPGPKVVSLVDGTEAAGLDLARLQDMGFSICLFAITTLLASLTAQAAALQQLRSTGRIPADAEGFDYARFSELVDLAGHQAFAHEYEA